MKMFLLAAKMGMKGKPRMLGILALSMAYGLTRWSCPGCGKFVGPRLRRQCTRCTWAKFIEAMLGGGGR